MGSAGRFGGSYGNPARSPFLLRAQASPKWGLVPRGRVSGAAPLISTAPGAARAAAEHLQGEHQPLSQRPGVCAGQLELLLMGAEGVAAATVGVHLHGVGVEAAKEPRRRVQIKASASRALLPSPAAQRAGSRWVVRGAPVADFPSLPVSPESPVPPGRFGGGDRPGPPDRAARGLWLGTLEQSFPDSYSEPPLLGRADSKPRTGQTSRVPQLT